MAATPISAEESPAGLRIWSLFRDGYGSCRRVVLGGEQDALAEQGQSGAFFPDPSDKADIAAGMQQLRAPGSPAASRDGTSTAAPRQTQLAALHLLPPRGADLPSRCSLTAGTPRRTAQVDGFKMRWTQVGDLRSFMSTAREF